MCPTATQQPCGGRAGTQSSILSPSHPCSPFKTSSHQWGWWNLDLIPLQGHTPVSHLRLLQGPFSSFGGHTHPPPPNDGDRAEEEGWQRSGP